MQVSIAVGVMDHVFPSSSRSLSWSIIAALKDRQRLTLARPDGEVLGNVLGAVPLLQPFAAVSLQAGGTECFVQFIKLVVRLNHTYSPQQNDILMMRGAAGELVAELLLSYASDRPYDRPPLTAVATRSAWPADAEQVALSTYTFLVTCMMWNKEPINWTTDDYHLTSEGILMSATEIARYDASYGVLVLGDGRVFFKAGKPLAPISFRPACEGAGQTVPHGPGLLAQVVAECGEDGDGDGDGDGGDGGGDSDGDGC